MHSGDILRQLRDIVAIVTTFMESTFIDATIIIEFVLEVGLVLAGPIIPVPPALDKSIAAKELLPILLAILKAASLTVHVATTLLPNPRILLFAVDSTCTPY